LAGSRRITFEVSRARLIAAKRDVAAAEASTPGVVHRSAALFAAE
jgi:hypothetical protein